MDGSDGPAGMEQSSLHETDVAGLYAQLSERAVLISFVDDGAVLPFLQFARLRGLLSFVHVGHETTAGSGLDDISAPSRQCADSTRRLCATLAGVTQRLQRQGHDNLFWPMALDHVRFDAYRHYGEPAQFKREKRGKVVVFMPGGDTAIDRDYLVRAAKSNPGVTFFMLGIEAWPSLPADNLIFLPQEFMQQAAAFIAHADLVLAPVNASAANDDAALQCILAGAFLNRPVASSRPVAIDHLDSLHHCPEPGSLSEVLDQPRHAPANDRIVAAHSWLGRLEMLLPGHPRADVSVVILIHNNASIISRCLETLLQHCRAYIHEVIVVDNASVDGGAALVERRFPSVKLIRNPENGCSSGRNLGVRASTGRYIAFFDSDQWFTGSSGFAEALAILEKNALVGAVGWNAGWFDATRGDLGGMIADYCPNRAMNPAAVRRGYRSDIGFLGTSGFFMRRATFDATAGFDTFYDPTCFEDTDLCFQIRALGMELAFRDLSGIRHQPHQTTGADSGSDAYRKLFLRNSEYFKVKWRDRPHFFVDYSF